MVLAEERDGEAAAAPVWFASASVDANAGRPILPFGWHDDDKALLTNDEVRRRAQLHTEVRRQYSAGQLLKPENLGTHFSLRKGCKKPARAQPFMQLFGRMAVTAETRALLEGLDPGPLHFHRIEVLNSGRTGQLWQGTEQFVMQVLTCRRDVVIEDSLSLRKRMGVLEDGEARYSVMSPDRDDVLVLPPLQPGSAEAWLDDRLDGALFLSDRIVRALKAAKLTRGWGLRRCVVKTVH